MGMPCEINSIVKLSQTDFPDNLVVNDTYTIRKTGYRIFPIEVPLQLVDANWMAHADVAICQLIWAGGETQITFQVVRCYVQPQSVK
jgi:hypothetical protein